MRVLVVHAHPVAESFNGALHRLIVEKLAGAGHDVDDCDLYAEDFEPRLTRSERLDYHDPSRNTLPVAGHVERLRRAEGLVLSHPVWNFGYPAIMKGWFDRVFLPGVSFDIIDGVVRPKLRHIRKVAAATTYGGTRLRAFLAGDPPRKMVMRVLRVQVALDARFRYLAHYDMNRSTPATREAFLKRVGSEMERF